MALRFSKSARIPPWFTGARRPAAKGSILTGSGGMGRKIEQLF
jgi:hypothetical protein